MKLLISFLIVISSCLLGQAQTVDTIAVYSPSMNKEIKSVVILPEGYDKGKDYPVLYLLHGYGATIENGLR